MTIDIVIFAAIVVFLFLRLRSVLGQRTGTEQPRQWRGEAPQNTTATPAPATPPKSVDFSAYPEEAQPALQELNTTDPNFDPKEFLQGAQIAFEEVLTNFANGNKAALRSLLSPAVYKDFSAEIDARQKSATHTETTLVSILSADIDDAALEGKSAYITVRFVSEQVNITRDDKGNVVEGSPTKVDRIQDTWVFERAVRSRDPNWILTSTDGET